VLGGWLVDQISWRRSFCSNVPLALAAAGLAAGFACESRDPQGKPLDWNGAAAVAIGLAAITWGLGALPASGFHDKTVLGALGSGAAFLAAFVAIEARSGERADDAAVAVPPAQFYRNQRADTAALLRARGTLYFLPFGLIRIGGYSATLAGAALLRSR